MPCIGVYYWFRFVNQFAVNISIKTVILHVLIYFSGLLLLSNGGYMPCKLFRAMNQFSAGNF